jgi:sugar phosphate permease
MLWLICFFNYADRQAVFSVFPLLQREMHLDTFQLGLLGSCFAWVYGLGGPLAGIAIDRIRRKSAILSGLQFWSVVCAATALSRTFRQLLFFRTAEGLGETVYYPASVSMLSDYHGPKTRSRALGLMQTSVYAGTVGGGFWAATMAERHGWRFSFVVLGGLGGLLGLVLLKYLREPSRGGDEPSAQPVLEKLPLSVTFLSIVRSKTVLLLMTVFVCANFVAMVLLSWMPTYLYGRFHLGLAEAALDATMYPQLASIAGALCGGYMADFLTRKTLRGRLLVQAGGLLIATPFVVIAGRAGSLHQVLAALVCWGFCKGVYDANIFASVFDFVPPAARGTTSGLMNCVGWLLGAGTAPLIIGLLAPRYSLGFAISLSASVYVLGTILLVAGMAWFAPREVLKVE